MGNYVIGVGNYVIVSPSNLGNYKIADSVERARNYQLGNLNDASLGTGPTCG